MPDFAYKGRSRYSPLQGEIVGYRDTEHYEYDGHQHETSSTVGGIGVECTALAFCVGLELERFDGLDVLTAYISYNSVLFLTVQANVYNALPADQALLDSGIYNTTIMTKGIESGESNTADSRDSTALVWNMSQWSSNTEQMSPLRCLEVYKNQYMSARGDVLIIQSDMLSPITVKRTVGYYKDLRDQNSQNHTFTVWDRGLNIWSYIGVRQPGYVAFPVTSWPDDYPSYNWQCGVSMDQKCEAPDARSMANWAPFGSPVHSCLSEKVPEHCELNWNLGFAIAVIIGNLAKVICMFLTLWYHDNSTLITIGDAIQSFLNQPDIHTRGLCMQSQSPLLVLMRRRNGTPPGGSPEPIHDAGSPKSIWRRPSNRETSMKWTSQNKRWRKAASNSRWLVCLILCVALNLRFIFGDNKFANIQKRYLVMLLAAIHGIRTIIQGNNQLALDWNSLRSTGLGQPTGNNLLPMNKSILITAIVANTLQAILSYAYIHVNALFTCMVSGREWTQFAKHRKPLRVSSPIGQQRSTFWLQLPYRYCIPLMVASTLLSWLTSQGFFFVKINVLDRDRPDGNRTIRPDLAILTCGLSPGALILALIVGALILLVAFALGFRRYDSDMPMVSTSSAVISAACHPLGNDPDAALLPVEWGVASKKNGIGHCCFSSKIVAPPTPGHLYM
ncbi:MAG: hypothetical protein Q9169_007194 [Polycauliona sp. 2 TL-2023]